MSTSNASSHPNEAIQVNKTIAISMRKKDACLGSTNQTAVKTMLTAMVDTSADDSCGLAHSKFKV